MYLFQTKSPIFSGFFLHPFWDETASGEELELTLKRTCGIYAVYLQSTMKDQGETPANVTRMNQLVGAVGYLSPGKAQCSYGTQPLRCLPGQGGITPHRAQPWAAQTCLEDIKQSAHREKALGACINNWGTTERKRVRKGLKSLTVRSCRGNGIEDPSVKAQG